MCSPLPFQKKITGLFLATRIRLYLPLYVIDTTVPNNIIVSPLPPPQILLSPVTANTLLRETAATPSSADYETPYLSGSSERTA